MSVTRWHRATTRLGRVRQWIRYRVLGRDDETCQRCGRGYYMAWWCDDPPTWQATYERATGQARGSSGLLCPVCFEKFCGAPIEWVPRRIGKA